MIVPFRPSPVRMGRIIKMKNILSTIILFSISAMAGPVIADASVSDDFNRSGIGYTNNAAVALVNADWTNGGNPDTQWAISGNKVITRTLSGSGNAVIVNTVLETVSGGGKRFTLSADLMPLIAANWAGVVWGYKDASNYYFLQMKAATNTVFVYKVVNGVASAVGNSAAASANFLVGGTNTVTITSTNAYNFNVTITDKGTGATLLSTSRTDTGSSFADGYAGLILTTPGNTSRFAFDNFSLQGTLQEPPQETSGGMLFALKGSQRPLAVLPAATNGAPQPGKFVAAVEPEYAGTDVHHMLYLPVNYDQMEKCPVIVELTGNYSLAAGSTGKVEGAHLGFSLSLGRDFIWVVLPYVSSNHIQNELTWWGDNEATAAYARMVIPRIIQQYKGDSNAVILCGFSRGAIGVSYVGLQDDQTAALWSAFFSHDHFDGEREWTGLTWGSPLATYREAAVVRLGRVGGRPWYVSYNPSTAGVQDFLNSSGFPVKNFTFAPIPMTQIFTEIPNQWFYAAHNDVWPVFDTPYGSAARQWIKKAAHLE